MLDIFISIMVAVTAGVICHFVCKWLDSIDDDN